MFQAAIDEIIELRNRVERYRQQLPKSELMTRYVLIDPFLRLLGWDVEDPGVVRPEFTTQAGRPDYALLHGSEKPLAFIGAKSLGKQEDLQQYITYCVNEGVRYFVATDGARWEVYDTILQKPLMEKKIAEWDIVGDEPGEVLRRAFILFRYSPFKGEAQRPITTTEVTKQPTEGEPLSRVNPKLGSPLMYREIVFPDGQRYRISRWNDILANAVDWLIKTRGLKREYCPIKIGPKRYLVNTQPIHPSGRKFKNYREISGLYVELSFNIRNAIKHTRKMLKDLGIDPSEVRLVKSQTE